jgi:Cu/Zn superoxide dismutase
MTRKALMLLATVALMVVAASAVAAASTMDETQTASHVRAHLESVGGSGVHGTVNLFQLPKEGTEIVVFAKGLTPGKKYISLYYDNPRCANPDEDDVIGGPYTALPGGFGFTIGTADDDLDEIHGVSVRSAKSFHLRACARVES